MGAFVEGEGVLLLGGMAACLHLLALPWVIVSGVAGTVLADQVYFTLGRKGGAPLLARRPRLRARAGRVLGLLERHPALLIVGYRYLYGLRTATLVALGMSRVPLSRFLPLNLLGAVLWTGAVAGAGYLFGSAADTLPGFASEAARAVPFLLAAAVAVALALRLRRP
jgi:membrane protein DedA with SNARE-associated domain